MNTPEWHGSVGLFNAPPPSAWQRMAMGLRRFGIRLGGAWLGWRRAQPGR